MTHEVDTDVDEHWTPTGPGIALRLLAAVVLAYFTIIGGAFASGPWISVASGFAIAVTFLLTPLRLMGRHRLAVVLASMTLICGALIAPHIATIGGAYYFLAANVLIARMLLPLRVSVTLVGVGGVILVIAVTRGASAAATPVLLSGYGAGVLAVIFFGIIQRQSRRRQSQDRALVARSRELERRSAELLAQTELTQAENARAAALEERARIARDIHDVLAHSLGGLVVQLDAAEALLVDGGNVSAAAEKLRASRQLAVEGLQEARQAVSELREPTDSSFGERDLVAAVRRLAYGPVGVQLGVDLDTIGNPFVVPAPVADCLAAVTREALTNITKHAGGGRVTLSLLFGADDVRLEIGNETTGATPTELAATGGGVGLTGMAERIAEVGGSLRIESTKNRWVVSAEWRRR